MRVLVLGGDGYLGWPTSMHLSNQGHEVAIVDSIIKRHWEAQIGAPPLFRVSTLQTRVKRWQKETGKLIPIYIGDIAEDSRFIYKVIDEFKPHAVVHYAEQPSAPYSMISRSKAVETQRNNVLGTLNLMFAIQNVDPDIHIVKLGTMGEYGTPNIDIEEGWIDISHKGRTDRVLYPKRPPSFYHLSKVHDSANLEFACRAWEMRVTDLNQGIVYGVQTSETILHPELQTSFHYDAVFGTVLNRFICQAVISHPLTVYGRGNQKRGMLNIVDTLKCIELAINNPAEKSQFRVFNQFTEIFSINELASMVVRSCEQLNIQCSISNLKNPRAESDDHYFNAAHTALPSLGLVPNLLTNEVLLDMINEVIRYKENICTDLINPTVQWHTNAKN
jgi:UDP-sulfoquinovose synthase